MLNMSTNKCISRSNARLIGDPSSLDIIADHITAPKVVKSLHVDNDGTWLPSTHLEDNNDL